MSKSIRNTVFTSILLVLTGLGVSWNEVVALQRTPVAIGQSVLAEFSGGERTVGSFQLNVEISRQEMLLGQTQVVTIQTLPFADLDLVLKKNDGTFDEQLTTHVSADELGRYSWQFRLNDFRSVGTLEVIVKAILGVETSAARKIFTLQTWNNSESREEFFYPILP